MDRLQHIYDVIAKDGFSDEALQEIDKYIKEIIMSHEGQNPGVTLTFRSFDEEGVINNLL